MAFRKAAKLGEVPRGGVKVVEAGGEEVLLCNVEGTLYAVANCCTHDGGPLVGGTLLGDEIECPRHGARFCVRTGEVRSLPAVVPVPTYPIRIERDDIQVDVEF